MLRGKVLGGSSCINGMIHIRGNAMDYEKWAREKGLENWDYARCLPYFKRFEYRLKGADEYQGGAGPLYLTSPDCDNPLFDAFFQAVQQAGYPLTEDVNGFQQEGFGSFDRTCYRGRRWNAARAYVHPVKNRENLDVVCRAHATRILFEGDRAVGVEYRRGTKQVRATGGEIICCGGAINSPSLLQLSGIGNGEALKGLGLPVVRDLPGVGENLQDHLEVYVQYACKQPVSLFPYLKWWRQPKVGLDWLFGRKGIGATNHFEAGGFIRSNDQVAYPNLQYHFLPIAIRYDGSSPQGGHGYQVHVGPMNTDVRGTVFLNWEYEQPDREDDKWLYMPALKKERRISGASKNEYFMGTDFTYDDMGDRNVDEDTHTLLGEERLRDRDCWKIEAIPVDPEDMYTRRVLWVDKEANLILQGEYYDKDGLVKVYRALDVRQENGIWTTFRSEMDNVSR
ncbi:MAG: outer membrane lipoprotein-sorting protein, partial [Opitutae bacterium]|nr:outer membrane lipoprotein-sorting protein [Opitutae bacterium]